MQITANAVSAGVERQQLIITKEPGQPLQCTVLITTDAPHPNDRISVSFPLGDVAGGPSTASLVAIRDHAKALKSL